ncbi:hypothetical protein TTHERM_00429850 (macronuclear) [Tetrahymena thermophila SB210]|uniref:Uncharacterized protein n=1 Tax=Tetrahymena thermophila (strain SB210) TaxID=312017 RepID=Q231H5_TETTS|nr:hypothetical protein TTHERM_00429850 [Tetrahymena thermophila SB210]EAR91064.1 hypothetical protein TTHERM_00429850 [Tetrahymena thermophila SB210]|eukprot:XP_001011309.1 hypothetical protein TTHERM_00429850 [Tetrahymena thermophila SB210]
MQLKNSSVFQSNSKAVFGNALQITLRNQEQRTEFGSDQVQLISNQFHTPRSLFYQSHHIEQQQQQLGYQYSQRELQKSPQIFNDRIFEEQLLFSQPNKPSTHLRKQQQINPEVPQKSQSQQRKQNKINNNDDLFIDLNQIHKDFSTQFFGDENQKNNNPRRSLPSCGYPNLEASLSPFSNSNQYSCNNQENIFDYRIQNSNKHSIFISQSVNSVKYKPFDLLEECKNQPQHIYSNSPAHKIYDQFNQHQRNNSNQNTPTRRELKPRSNEDVLNMCKNNLDKENKTSNQLDKQEQKAQNQINSKSRARNINFSSFINDIQNSFNQDSSQQNQVNEKTELNQQNSSQLIQSSQNPKPYSNSVNHSPQIKNGSQKSILKPPKEKILDFFNELVDVTKSPQNKKVTFTL